MMKKEQKIVEGSVVEVLSGLASVEKVLYTGREGVQVFQIRNLRTNNRSALKIVPKASSSNILRELKREVEVLLSMGRKEGFQKIKSYGKIGDYVYMETDLCSEGDLLDHVTAQPNGKLREIESKILFKQMCTAVKTLHEAGYAHRDLKCDNFFIHRKTNNNNNNNSNSNSSINTSNNSINTSSNNSIENDLENENRKKTFGSVGDFDDIEVCVADFAHCIKTTPTEFKRDRCGTMAYACVELYDRLPHNGFQVDVWQLGLTLYAMTSGLLPFSHKPNQEDVFYAVEKLNISRQLSDLLIGMLQIDAKLRYTIDEVCEHPWLNQKRKPSLMQSCEELRGSLNSLSLNNGSLLASGSDSLLSGSLERTTVFN